MRIKPSFFVLGLLCATQINFALPQVGDADDILSSTAQSSNDSSSYLSSTGPVATPDLSSNTSQKNNSINDDLLTKLNALEDEVQTLQGRVDELQHALKQSQTEQAQQFLILNKKLAEAPPAPKVAVAATTLTTQTKTTSAVSAKTTTAVVSKAASSSPKAVAAPPPEPPLSADAQEKATYDAAYSLVTAKAYTDAIEAFTSYLSIYPQGKFSANANYWLGELNASQQAYPEAMKYLQVVVDKYPESNKVPDALLKLGIINKRLGNDEKAQTWFNQLLKQYPTSNSAKSAKEYMN